MHDTIDRELAELEQLQAEIDQSNALLAEVWDTLEARGQDAIAISDAELTAIGESCTPAPVPRTLKPTFGLRC